MQCGVYRCVLCIGNIAIKLPRITRLIKGLRCNRWESEMWKVWRPIFGWENLCPVIIAGPAGIFLLMRRAAQPVTFEEVKRINTEDYDYYPDINVEYKPENWGKVENKLVCLDYGIEDKNLIKERRSYLESKRSNFSVT